MKTKEAVDYKVNLQFKKCPPQGIDGIVQEIAGSLKLNGWRIRNEYDGHLWPVTNVFDSAGNYSFSVQGRYVHGNSNPYVFTVSGSKIISDLFANIDIHL